MRKAIKKNMAWRYQSPIRDFLLEEAAVGWSRR